MREYTCESMLAESFFLVFLLHFFCLCTVGASSSSTYVKFHWIHVRLICWSFSVSGEGEWQILRTTSAFLILGLLSSSSDSVVLPRSSTPFGHLFPPSNIEKDQGADRALCKNCLITHGMFGVATDRLEWYVKKASGT